jgi:hypothetical protein
MSSSPPLCKFAVYVTLGSELSLFIFSVGDGIQGLEHARLSTSYLHIQPLNYLSKIPNCPTVLFFTIQCH